MAKGADVDDAIREKVASVRWFQTFEIVPGVVSPGRFVVEPVSFAERLGIPERLDGLRALDIGTWDGPMAFELERRGASVVALDIHDPARTGFNVARELKASQVDYVQGSVYDLERLLGGEQFDLIVFLNVYYHLKHPILAFESIASCLKPDAVLYLAGECFLGYAETLGGDPVTGLEQFAHSDVPIALCYPGVYKKQGNWIIPNVACIRSWLQAAGLTLTSHAFYQDAEARPHPMQRMRGQARKTRETRLQEHPLVGIDMLKP